MFGGQSSEPQSQPPSSFAFSAQPSSAPQQAQTTGFGAASSFGATTSSSAAQAGTFGSSAPGGNASPSGLFGRASQPSSGQFGSASQPSSGLFGSAPPQTSVFSSCTAPSFAAPSQQSVSPLPAGTKPSPFPNPKSYEDDQIITAFEIEGSTANMLIVVCGKQFRLSSRLAARRSRKVLEESEGKESVTLEVDLPLSSDPTPFIKWLLTGNHQLIQDHVKSMEALVDMLALGTYFDLDPSLHFEASVLSCSVPVNFSVFSSLPATWDRAFLPLPLVIKAINSHSSTQSHSLFGNPFPHSGGVATMMALEWLGERRCFTPAEEEALRASAAFAQMKRVLLDNYFLPSSLQEYLVIAKRYPVAVDVLTIGDMFKSLRLI